MSKAHLAVKQAVFAYVESLIGRLKATKRMEEK